MKNMREITMAIQYVCLVASGLLKPVHKPSAAIVWGCEVYCFGCLPEQAKNEVEAGTPVYPIKEEQEWDYPPTCCVCGKKQNVTLSEYGKQRQEELERGY